MPPWRRTPRAWPCRRIRAGTSSFFEYLVESLRAQGAGHVKVVGGGGGVIVHDEIERLRASGVTIFSPEDGQRMGLVGMINSVVRDCDFDLWAGQQVCAEQVLSGDRFAIARAITAAEQGQLPPDMLEQIRAAAARHAVPVLGITGTGGSGKSSLTDELVRRFRIDQQDKLRVAVIAVDPTRRKGSGALLGDRIRMNSVDGDRVFFRSLATRGAHELPAQLSDVIDVVKAAGFDLVVVETPGIGQGDAAIVPFVDLAAYVMTPEYGAASQLEKIDMLDFANVVAINKFERVRVGMPMPPSTRAGATAFRDEPDSETQAEPLLHPRAASWFDVPLPTSGRRPAWPLPHCATRSACSPAGTIVHSDRGSQGGFNLSSRRERQTDRPGADSLTDRAVGPRPPGPPCRARPADPPLRRRKYTSIRFTEDLELEEIAPSIGTVGNAYDNALMESLIGLFKTEAITTTVFSRRPLQDPRRPRVRDRRLGRLVEPPPPARHAWNDHPERARASPLRSPRPRAACCIRSGREPVTVQVERLNRTGC